MCVSNKIQFDRRKHLEENMLECIWIKIYVKKLENHLFRTIYQPPDGSDYLPTCFNNSSNNMLSSLTTKSTEVTLLGDTNVDYLKKNDNLPIKNIFHIHGFQQFVTKPTRITECSKTLIDTVFTTNASTIAHTDVNAAWCFIKDMITTVFNRHAPFIEKQVKDPFRPWLSTEIRRQMNNRDKALRKARKTNNKTDWNFDKTLRNRFTNYIRETNTNCNKNRLAESSNNPSWFWKITKEIIPVKCKNATSRPLFVEAESNKISNPVKISNTFCSFFTNVASTLKKNSILIKGFIWCNPPKINETVSPQFAFQYVPSIFIENELKHLKRIKVTGTGNLPANLLKYSAVEISSPLYFLINLTLKTAKVPTEFKLALINPIHKSGSVTDMNN